jgi:hypothetical protein
MHAVSMFMGRYYFGERGRVQAEGERVNMIKVLHMHV